MHLMVVIVRSFLRVFFALSLVLVLGACSGSSAGLNAFQSADGRYGFFYPTGWTRISVGGGPEVVYHDLINSDETLSLVISKLEEDAELKTLGSPEIVGKRLVDQIIAPEGAGREVELLEASQRESSGHTFYDLEYSIHLPDRERHELTTFVVDHGYLYTFATSTNEVRWPKVKSLFRRVIDSFTFLI